MAYLSTRREFLWAATGYTALSVSCRSPGEPHSAKRKACTTAAIEAIDVHGHVGLYKSDAHKLINDFMTGDAATVLERARQANTRWTIVSPLQALLPRLGADPETGNIEARRIVEENDGLLQWVVIDPLKPRTFDQAREMLPLPKCVGIKIHPEEHGYPITEHGRKLFAFAAEHQAVMLSHSGQKNSLPEDLVPLADDFPEVTLILAHLGNGWNDDPGLQVRAIEAGKRGNVFVDTSSAKSITPGLIEWAVDRIGSDKILFGTDTPVYFAPMQRARIDHAAISDVDKRRILRDNAAVIFHL